MKVAIAGSAGFIGSNLVEECLRKGWSVIGVDNLSAGTDEMADPARYIDLPGFYSFIKLDINDTEKLAEVMRGCDVVFHLAALPRVSFSTDYPLVSHEANATGTLSVLEASRKARVSRVVFSCSSSIFGGTSVFPSHEDLPMKPLSNYALQKVIGAEYCRLYSDLYGLETVSLIYYNVYGKHQRTGGAYSTVVPAFFEAAVKGEVCRVDGDGLQSRDLCHVDNVVHANILAAEHKDKMLGQRFNVANGETHSVIEVYEIVKDLMGVDLQKNHVKARLGDPRKSHADVSKIKEVLGYTTQVGFFDGMKLTAEWWLDGCKI
jgi:nucleoside-diphosphate-sugar epimerase